LTVYTISIAFPMDKSLLEINRVVSA
jgi:hypothetical protein